MYRLICILFFIIHFSVQAQDKFYTKTGEIEFVSRTPFIDIAGYNKDVISFLSIKTGDVVFAVVMKAFKFDLPLAEEHFNENYVESEIYPNAKFKGKILNFSADDFNKAGSISVLVEGEMTIHGVIRTIKQTATLVIGNKSITGRAVFKIVPEEYGIKIPTLVSDKIAKEVDVLVKMEYVPYTK